MKALLINLTEESFEWKEINDESIEYYLGGRGLGARYLIDNLAPGTDALGPENILSFWSSPLIGTGAMSVVKLCGVTKSPTTGTILMSLMGGYAATELRAAGVDALIFTGKAIRPVYLTIIDGKVELKDASNLWGKFTSDTAMTIREELNLQKSRILTIGPAGEKLNGFASILEGGNAMGRGGIGAVMGSKNLKAIVVSGQIRPQVVDNERFSAKVKLINKKYIESPVIRLYGSMGTPSHVEEVNVNRFFPTRNYQSNYFDDYEKVDGATLYERFVQKRVTCSGCLVRCRRYSQVTEGKYKGTSTEGPEYESLWALSGNCGNNSLEAVLAANYLCAEYGMDTISTGSAISFAMECCEKGILTKADVDGLDLVFGNGDAMVEMIRHIGERSGFGDILANGTKKAAEIIGKGSIEYSMQVKGLEMAAYDPRTIKGMGLGYATSPRGACQERGFPPKETWGRGGVVDRLVYEGKAAMIIEEQHVTAVKDALGFCVLSSVGMDLTDLAEYFSAATGMEKSVADLMEIGERICNIERMFNVRESFTRKDDSLPKRLLKEPVLAPDGNYHVVDLNRMLDEYYPLRGWDEEGRPTDETLSRLRLGSNAPGSKVLKD